MRNLTYLAICAALAVGCRNDPMMMGQQDLSASMGDMGGGDMAVQRMYMDTTPNAIDTGAVTKNSAVRLTGMVVTTPVLTFLKNMNECTYEVWVQDPACAAPPCGLVVIAESSHKAPGNDPDPRDCPAATQSGSLLATVRLGDNLDVTGIVDIFAQAGKPTQHEVELDSVTVTGGTEVATVFPVTDPASFPNGMMAAGWTTYEGTLVKVSSMSGNLTVVENFPMNRPTFRTSPGDAIWAYSFLFDPANRVDGMTFPPVNAEFKSITGVVNTLPVFGGQLLPRNLGDFEAP